MEISNAFLTVAAGSTAAITAYAAMAVGDLPQKGRNFLFGLSLLSTIYTTANLAWTYAPSQKPNCP